MLTGLKTRTKFTKSKVGLKYASYDKSSYFLELSEYQIIAYPFPFSCCSISIMLQ